MPGSVALARRYASARDVPARQVCALSMPTGDDITLAAGAHGTVDEPLNNCFPSRLLFARYADGATLAEAFHGSLPYVYWLNLVLGDPMLAPYARRPRWPSMDCATAQPSAARRRSA